MGGTAGRRNIGAARAFCAIRDEMLPTSLPVPPPSFIKSAPARPGHDRRYAMDTSKIARELGWRPRQSFESGLRETVSWYLANRQWWERVLTGDYRVERLGLGPKTGKEAAR